MQSFRGFHTLVDSTSLLMHNVGAQSSARNEGAGVFAIANSPGSDTRLSCLRFTAAHGATDKSYIYQTLVYGSSGWNRNTSVGLSRATTKLHFRGRIMLEVLPGSGGQCTFAQIETTNDVFSMAITSAGNLLAIQNLSSGGATTLATSTNTVSAGQWFEIRITRDVPGTSLIYAYKRQGDASWTTLHSGTVPGSTGQGVSAFRLGLRGFDGTSSANTVVAYVDDYATSDNNFTEIDRHWYIAGSGCRDANQAKSNPVLICPPGTFRNATQARILYAANINLTGAITSAWVALSGRQFSALRLPLENLTPDTQYTYRFQVGTADGTIVFESENYRFRTFPLKGAEWDIDHAFHVHSCIFAHAAAHPYADLDNVTAVANNPAKKWLGCINLGDWGYEEVNGFDAAVDTQIKVTETTQEFEQLNREIAQDISLHELMRAGTYSFIADDHEFYNNGNAQSAPGQPLADTLANSVLPSPYSASVTLGQLFVRGYQVYDAWFLDHWLDQELRADIASGLYLSKSFGTNKWLVVDVRRERRPDLSKFVSDTQFTWIKNQITAFANDSVEKTLYIFSQGGFSAFTSKPDESWETNAQAQYREFMEHIYTVVPVSKRVVLISGDDHVGYWVHNKGWKNGAYSKDLPFAGEIKSSAIVNGLWRVSDTEASDNSTYTMSRLSTGFTSGNQNAIRSSGVIIEPSAEGTGITLQFWYNGNQLMNNFSFSRNAPSRLSTLVGAANVAGFRRGQRLSRRL